MTNAIRSRSPRRTARLVLAAVALVALVGPPSCIEYRGIGTATNVSGQPDDVWHALVREFAAAGASVDVYEDRERTHSVVGESNYTVPIAHRALVRIDDRRAQVTVYRGEPTFVAVWSDNAADVDAVEGIAHAALKDAGFGPRAR